MKEKFRECWRFSDDPAIIEKAMELFGIEQNEAEAVSASICIMRKYKEI